MLTDTCAGVLETALSMAEATTNDPKYFKTRISFSFDHQPLMTGRDYELCGSSET